MSTSQTVSTSQKTLKYDFTFFNDFYRLMKIFEQSSGFFPAIGVTCAWCLTRQVFGAQRRSIVHRDSRNMTANTTTFKKYYCSHVCYVKGTS